ncbi:hypothetical protein [Streptomyces roseolilacinus]
MRIIRVVRRRGVRRRGRRASTVHLRFPCTGSDNGYRVVDGVKIRTS